jgi:hypothetical protein
MRELLRRWYRSRLEGPWVRPWGLAAPILVLVVCLPMLRPLLHPTDVSENERQRIETIQAIVERHSFNLSLSGPAQFSSQPPVLSALLAGPYWVMHRWGLGLDSSPLAAYILTLLGSTLPVAAAGGMVYRMGRLFELQRPWRMVLAVSTVFGSGLVAYATVLNSHAPGAALVLAACGCFFHACTARTRGTSIAWFGFGGFAVALAAVIDLGAIAFLLLLPAIILALRWPLTAKAAGISAYLLGALGPILLHAVLTVPQTGDMRPGLLHVQLLPPLPPADDEDAPSPMTVSLLHFADGVLGPHGLLSHFPVILFGIGGVGAVLHRHWPPYTKALAVVCFMAALMIVGVYITVNCNWDQPMISARWFIIFMPALLFWAGAWLRKSHHPVMWSIAGALLVVSTLASVLGAAAPFPPTARNGEYTLVSAIRYLVKGAPATVQAQPRGRPPITTRPSK